MKLVRTEDAVGQVLCHDITQIIPGVVKDAVFRKGHIVTEEDIPVLLSVGKENLYIWEKQEGMLHENEAAEILRQICQGEHMHPSEVKEGKIELIADCEGVLKINTEKLNAVNSLGAVSYTHLIINCNRHHRIKHGNRPRYRLRRTPRTSAQTKSPKQTQTNTNSQTFYFHRKPPQTITYSIVFFINFLKTT